MTAFRPVESLDTVSSALPQDRTHRLVCAETHTAGELTRIVLGGGPPLPKLPPAELRPLFQREHDSWRRRLTWEPRGHRDVVVAWVLEPTSSENHFGLLLMDAKRYPLACGTATVGAVTALLDLGLIEPDEDGQIRVETPSGLVRARLVPGDQQHERIELEMIPACLLWDERKLDLGSSDLLAGLGFVGGFLLLVEQSQIPFPISPLTSQRLIALGERLIETADRQWRVYHPETGEPTTVDGVIFYDAAHHDQRLGYGTVMYGDAHIDRSPCGTGTAVKMALLSHQDALKTGETFVNRGLLDTVFTGRLHEEVKVGPYPGVVVHLRASAYLTGVHEYFEQPGDPLTPGYLLGQPDSKPKPVAP